MITYDVVGRVATIVIDDPDRRNALSNAAMDELRAAVERSAVDPDVGVVVLTGAGDRAFSAGGDLSGGFVDAPLTGHGARGSLADLLRAMQMNPKPIIGRVNGVALGGGFGLAVACDITIAVDDARMGTPEIDLGLWPMMISALLIRSMPRKVLVDMMMTGRILTATEAHDLGLVTRVVSGDRLDDEIAAVAASLLARSPAALALGKRSLAATADLDIDTALDVLHLGLTATALTEDGAEGVAAFVDKRRPEWKGR